MVSSWKSRAGRDDANRAPARPSVARGEVERGYFGEVKRQLRRIQADIARGCEQRRAHQVKSATDALAIMYRRGGVWTVDQNGKDSFERGAGSPARRTTPGWWGPLLYVFNFSVIILLTVSCLARTRVTFKSNSCVCVPVVHPWTLELLRKGQRSSPPPNGGVVHVELS
jgi:hypothetical protein